jgi:glycosyltransferase involved in cell wall biosynthesis
MPTSVSGSWTLPPSGPTDTRTPTIPTNGQQNSAFAYSSGPYDYTLYTFTAATTGTFTATVETTATQNTSWFLNGTFSPSNTTIPTTSISNFIAGLYSGGTASGGEFIDNFTGLNFTAGDTYSILLAYNSSSTSLASNYNISMTEGVACYRAGTRILTPSGEVPIEALASGDLVVTRSGEAKPIKWIGRRSYSGRFIAGNDDALPIRFAAGSLADGSPTRDLDVSPKHAMFIDDVLIPAEMLVNNSSIYQLADVESVDYFHLELEVHDVIFAEGAMSETFVDCDSRGMFHNVAEYCRQYPNDPGPAWQFCAPRIEPASPALVAVRTRLLARTGSPETFGPPDQLLGVIEKCDRVSMKGWVFDPAQPAQRVRLEVVCDGEIMGHVVADRFRGDLAEAGYLGDGHCSFSLLLPHQLNPLSSHVIELRRAVDGAPVPGSPVHVPAASRFDATCHAGLSQMLLDVAQTATQASDLDEVIVQQMAQTEALLAARARLDAGPRADVADVHSRWGGIVPTAEMRRSVQELRPRALFIDDVFPAPDLDGGSGAGAALDHMRALMRIGFDVSFAASQDLEDRSKQAGALAARGITPLAAPWYGSVEEMLRRHSGRFDAVYLHRAGNAAGYGKLVRQHSPQAQLIYGVADLHHVRLARQGAVEDRPELTRLAARQRMEELMAALLVDVVITHSDAEAALLRGQLPGVSVAVVPWAVPVHRSSRPFAERDGIVFVGHFGNEPNVDAMHWLAEEIVPLVQREEPSICFRIVGNAMPESLQLLARPGFELIEPVNNLTSVFDAARLTVAPLRYGAGIKAKVIESLAAGVPCVGTTIAFEGMALTPALDGCVADAPETFAAALIRLYRDGRAHAAVAEAGQRLALVNYSEGRIDALMHQALAPALRRWAGIADATAGGGAPAMRIAG